MEGKIYTLVINGKPQGPFSLEELKQQPISAESFLRTPEMDDYKEAHEFEEIRQILGFEKQYTAPQYFAGFDLRMLATCIDWFIVTGAAACIELILIILLDDRDKTISVLMANLLILPILKTIYQIIAETKYQVTVGKRLLNIKVTNLQGLKPSLNQVLSRNLFKIFSTAILFAGYLYSFLNKKQQCLHDVVAGTLVVKERLI